METLQQILAPVWEYLPSFAGALAILIVGWIVARIVAAIVRAGLRRTTLDDRLATWLAGEKGKEMNVEEVAGKIVFYTIMLFVLVAFFQTIGLSQLTEPLNGLLNQVFAFAPRLLGAAALLAIAWVVATVLRMLTTRVLSSANIDKRVGAEAAIEGQDSVPLSKTLGEAVYWLVFLFFLPAILGALALEGLLEPVQGMVNKILEYLPNIITAAAILVIGWFVARIIQRVVAGLLAAIGTDRMSHNVGFDRALGEQSLSHLLGMIVYVLVLIPVIISALNALGIEAVTRPASNMLDTMLGALPAMFAAAIVVALAYAIGKVLSGMLANILHGMGFDNLLSRLGFKSAEVAEGRAPSDIVGYLVLVAIMLFALVEASSLLGFQTMADLFSEFIVFGSHIVVAVVIFTVGLYLANLAATTINAGGAKQARLLSIGARTSILVLAGAMALRQLGVADEIITLAFGLTLGAIAVALAIAFGIGGRDHAARQLDRWHKSVQGE